MVFSVGRFKQEANSWDKRLYSRLFKLNELEGKEVVFEGRYGTMHLNEEEYIYPIYKEWCVEEKQLSML